MIYHKTEYRERRNHFAYFACSEELAGFDTQRESFLGPYRGWDNPAAVEARALVRFGGPRLGAHRLAPRPGRLWSPARRRQIIFVLGYHENPDDRNSIRPARRRSTSGRSSRSSPGTWSPRTWTPPLPPCASTGTGCWASSRSKRPTSTPTAWSISGMPTSAWSPLTCRARPPFLSRASGAAWAFATRTRTCWALSTWCRSGPASAFWTWRPPNWRAGAPITSTSP